MPKPLLIIIIVCLSLFCISCSPAVYEIQLEPDVFSLLKNKNFFEQYEQFENGDYGETFVLYEDKSIKFIVSKSGLSLSYCKLAEINITETPDSPLSAETERKYLFPCVPFCEDLLIKAYNTEESLNGETAD